MLEDGSIHYINVMFAEYHYDRADATREEFSDLRERLKNETNINLRKAIEW